MQRYCQFRPPLLVGVEQNGSSASAVFLLYLNSILQLSYTVLYDSSLY